MKRIDHVLWGLVLIVLGLIFGVNALGFAHIDVFFNGWWTLFIIVPCFIGMFHKEDRTGNLIGLAIGIVLLLSCQNILDFGMVLKLIIPFTLVVWGLSLIFKDTIHSKRMKEIRDAAKKEKNLEEYCATFGSVTADYTKEEFKGASLEAVFGSVTCDLRGATIKKDVVISASAVFGGIDIYVPDDIVVKVRSTPIFGGVSNKTKNDSSDHAKTIYIDATCIFGGVEIK